MRKFRRKNRSGEIALEPAPERRIMPTVIRDASPLLKKFAVGDFCFAIPAFALTVGALAPCNRWIRWIPQRAVGRSSGKNTPLCLLQAVAYAGVVNCLVDGRLGTEYGSWSKDALSSATALICMVMMSFSLTLFKAPAALNSSGLCSPAATHHKRIPGRDSAYRGPHPPTAGDVRHQPRLPASRARPDAQLRCGPPPLAEMRAISSAAPPSLGQRCA